MLDEANSITVRSQTVEAGLSLDAFAEATWIRYYDYLSNVFFFGLIKWTRQLHANLYNSLVIAYRYELLVVETCEKPVHMLVGKHQY